MSKIKLLDPLIANKISAGEVVEKPASVVKEFVENSIDANSKNITIEIKNGGKDYIRVSDDGDGIYPDDILTAFERHATSKISNIEDIYNIQSLGFRGEALASICSVSNIELTTKIKDNEFGEKIQLSGGRVIKKESVGASNGTTIVMKDLFFNTPARLKFLKSSIAEQNAITNIVNKLALSHIDISFKYIINDKIIFKTSGNSDLKDAVYDIYGKGISKDLVFLEPTNINGVKVHGLISTIQFTRGNRQLQVVFVNGRYIVNKVISKTIELAYKGLVMVNRHPVCFLFIEIDSDKVDVNIHPSKTEIKFNDDSVIKQILYSEIRKTINLYNQIPTQELKRVDHFSNKQNEYEKKESNYNKTDRVKQMYVSVNNDYSENLDKSKFLQKSSSNTKYFDEKRLDNINENGLKKPTLYDDSTSSQYNIEEFIVREDNIKQDIEEREIIPYGESVYDGLNYIGQIFASYLLFQKNEQMYLIDQHAAHEKILYERFREKYRKRKINAQILLEPIIISTTHSEKTQILENKEEFKNVGFEIEEFGVNDVIIRAVPVLFDRNSSKLFMENLIEVIDENSNFANLQDEEIILQSCKSAIKANHFVHEIEVDELLKDLRSLEDPYTCPHGRPIIIAIHKYELERKFKRT